MLDAVEFVTGIDAVAGKITKMNGLLPKQIFAGCKTFLGRSASLPAPPFKAGLREAI
jgi:hypothetical protein